VGVHIRDNGQFGQDFFSAFRLAVQPVVRWGDAVLVASQLLMPLHGFCCVIRTSGNHLEQDVFDRPA
jgi:hypothetical protein